MVVNQTKVIPARLFVTKPETGAKLEILLIRPAYGEAQNEWETLISPAKRIKGNPILKMEPKGEAVVLESLGDGHFIVRFNHVGNFVFFLRRYGHIPLPPYIKRADDTEDRKRYQTLFAKEEGSVAAPTAGLHFTRSLVNNLKSKGIRKVAVTLHVGLGTFLPVSAEETDEHVMHPEKVEITPGIVSAFNQAKKKNGRIVAIGTTVVRALESMAQDNGFLNAGMEETRLFITPGYVFKTVDVLFTNFHQPRSTLLMLVCAFAGRERVLAAYHEALEKGYRFLSYGDAMLVL